MRRFFYGFVWDATDFVVRKLHRREFRVESFSRIVGPSWLIQLHDWAVERSLDWASVDYYDGTDVLDV